MAPMFNTTKEQMIALVILFLTMIVQSWTANAQFLSRIPYKGLDVSFGTRAFELESDIPELSNLAVLQDGGQVGVLLGTDVVRAKAGVAGFFYSANKVGRTVDLFQSDAVINFYPLMMAKNYTRIHPYLSGGVVYDKIKYFGQYLNPDKGSINYSTSKEPYLGNTRQLRGAIGGGVEFNVLNNGRDFVHLYTELKYSTTLTQSASHEIFNNTVSSGQLLINVGIRFGSNNQ